MSLPRPHVTQSTTLPPAQPAYILRGHAAQIHALHFLRQNICLLTGDANGWVVLWNLPTKRPAVVWRAHEQSILGMRDWDDWRVITHGRDNKLKVWQIREEDEKELSTALPIEDTKSQRKSPWLLHSLDVNTLNFCSLAICDFNPNPNPTSPVAESAGGVPRHDSILLAVPGVQDGMIVVSVLPSESRFATIPAPKYEKTGMVMAIGLHIEGGSLIVLAGYESGHAALWVQNKASTWEIAYTRKPHSQPVLSLGLALGLGEWFTSSVDAVIARHPLHSTNGTTDTKDVQTKHAGQQSLTVRSDDKIFATAGWDGRARVYSAKSMKELGVLKWHKEGCYALAFATVIDDATTGDTLSADDSTATVKARQLTVAQKREAKTRSVHWLALGSKDGKVSLWDVY